MCRLFAITSEDALSPMVAIRALDVMKEGHDGSGVGLLMTDLGGDLEQFRGSPIMSGIFSQEGIKKLDRYMMELGLLTKFKLSIRPSSAPPEGTPRRDVYLIRVYEYPYEWEGLSEVEIASVSYTHLRAHETVLDLVCRLLLEKKKKKTTNNGEPQWPWKHPVT